MADDNQLQTEADRGEESTSRSDEQTRRSVLTTVAAGSMAGLGLSTLPGAAKAASARSGTVVAEYGAQGNGLSEREIEDLQARAINKHKSRTGDSGPAIVGAPEVAKSEVETDLNVVSYAVKVYPDGTSRYHAGVVEDGQPSAMVAEAHQDTRSFVKEVTGQRRPTTEKTSVTTQSGDASYEYVAGGSVANKGCPEGTISIASNVYEWVNSDSNRTIFSTQADFQAIPGVNRDDCNGIWYNGYTENAKHRWNKSDLSGATQIGHEPAGGKSGSQSAEFTLSTSGASITWAYDQPNVERDDNSDLDETDWFYDYNSQSAAGQTCVWETGSEAEFDKYQDPDTGDKLYVGYFQHRFFDKYNFGAKKKDIAYHYKYNYG